MRWTGFSLIVCVVFASSPAQATFPGRNGDIVVTAQPPDQPRALFRIDARDGRFERVSPHAEWEDIAAAWSPDGTALAFTSDRSGDRDIWILTPRSTDPATNLTQTPTDAEWLPTWSPDGRVAFITEHGGSGRFTVDIIRTDGTERTTVAAPDGRIFGVEWSPRANRIVYALESRGQIAIESVRPGRPGHETWARHLRHAVIYDWRPDGRWVLFQGDADGRRALFEIAAAGDHRIRRLTRPGPRERDQHGAYSPTTSKAVYVRTRPGGDELWLVRNDGRHERVFRRMHRMRLFGVTWQALAETTGHRASSEAVTACRPATYR